MPYLEHGILELDNNTAERGMRAIALGRKNYLFVGSEAGGKAAAIAYTLIETAKLNGVDPKPGSPTPSREPQTTGSPGSTSCSPGIGAVAVRPDAYDAPAAGAFRTRRSRQTAGRWSDRSSSRKPLLSKSPPFARKARTSPKSPRRGPTWYPRPPKT